MNETYLHITLSHFPIVGSLIAIFILGAGWLQKSPPLIKASLILLVSLALLTVLVNHTGEEAEEFTEHLTGFSHDAIHEHEEAAELAFIAMQAVGLGSLLALYLLYRKSASARVVVLVVLLGNMAAFALLARAGKKAGYIRHTEVYEQQEKPLIIKGSDKETL